MNAPLGILCQRRLGFDPADLSETELRSRLPDIIRAVAAEYAYTSRQLVDVQKAAALHVQAVSSHVPNGEFVRDESLADIAASDRPEPDLNAVLESVLPV